MSREARHSWLVNPAFLVCLHNQHIRPCVVNRSLAPRPFPAEPCKIGIGLTRAWSYHRHQNKKKMRPLLRMYLLSPPHQGLQKYIRIRSNCPSFQDKDLERIVSCKGTTAIHYSSTEWFMLCLKTRFDEQCCRDRLCQNGAVHTSPEKRRFNDYIAN